MEVGEARNLIWTLLLVPEPAWDAAVGAGNDKPTDIEDGPMMMDLRRNLNVEQRGSCGSPPHGNRIWEHDITRFGAREGGDCRLVGALGAGA